MKKLKTIQSSLFITYSMIIISVLLVFVSFFYVWVSNVLRQRAVESIDNLTLSFQEKLDNEIHKMDDVSTNILYSNLVKKNFVNYIHEANLYGKEKNSNYISDTKELTDLLIAINGPSRPVDQIYLYDFKGSEFGTGFDNQERLVNVKSKPWYKSVVLNKNSKVIVLPHKDFELTRYVSTTNNITNNTYYISLCRLFFDLYSTPKGIVEVKKSCDKILGTVIDYMNSRSNHEQVYIYDRSGSLVYPIRDKARASDRYYFKYCTNLSDSSSSLTVRNPETNGRELLEYRYSDFSNWIIAVTVPENILFQPLYDFTKLIVAFAAIILLLALLFSFNAAKRYTRPIARLRRMLKEVDIKEDTYPSAEELGSGIAEFEELNKAFHKMNMKVKESVEHMILSEQHENQARMLALQSQMNPHFLYNALATISAMAESGMDTEISEMCISISDMLRYIATDKSKLVSMGTEIDYTLKYLSCMKLRFGSKITYDIALDPGMMNIHVPKLIVQPLVENSLKFCTLKEPPWIVEVTGKIIDHSWQISVKDNGPGFDSQKLAYINEKINEIEQTGLFPSLEVEGMGLLNIYIRMKLIYQNRFTFQILHEPENTILIVGGELDEQYGNE